MATESLKNIPTSALIDALMARQLSDSDITKLHGLKPRVNPKVDKSISANLKDNTLSKNAERIAAAVVRRNVHAKLPAEAQINGKQVAFGHQGGFYDHGDQIKLSAADRVVGSLQSKIYNQQDKYPDLMSSHLVSVTQSEADQRNLVLTVFLFQDRRQIDSRGWFSPAHLQIELPRQAMTDLITETQRNPDFLESFYQKVFPGLDNQDGKPGIRRAKADGFYSIAGANVDKAQALLRDTARDPEVHDFFKSLGKNKYRNGPYGTGDAFSPR